MPRGTVVERPDSTVEQDPFNIKGLSMNERPAVKKPDQN
jgi:hypothetical protein